MFERVARFFVRRPTQLRTHRAGLSVEPLEGRVVPAIYTAATVPELIAAIDAANLTPEADTINLTAGTTFTLTQDNNNTDGPTGLPVIAGGERLAINGYGSSIVRNTAAAIPAFRLFHVAAGASLTLHDLTLQGGLALGVLTRDSDWSQGGAVYNEGTLALDGVTVANNAAQGAAGGPIGFGGFRGSTDGMGGGVYSNGVLNVTGSTFRNNTAVGGRGVNAVTDRPPVTQGGPVPPSRGGPGATGVGGGLCVTGGTVAMSDSTVSGNTAQGGAGGNGFAITPVKTTAAGDGGDGLGGGLYASGGTLSFHLVSVSENSAAGGAGGNSGGKAGKGTGGGLYFAVNAGAGLDAFTVNHTRNNSAAGHTKNIFGTYVVIP
jgi:hypothetical protein